MTPFFHDRTPLQRLLWLGGMARAAGKEVEDTATGNPLTFLTDLAKPLKSLLIPFTPLQSGSGDPSPDNVRPITGWNGVTLWHTGKNLLNPTWWDNIADNKSYVKYEDGTLVYQSNVYKASDYVSVMGNTEYTLHAIMNGQNAGGIAFYDSSKQYISGIQVNSGTETDHTFTTPSNASYMRFWDRNDKLPWNEVMLVAGSTAPTQYEAYQGQSFPVSFPETIYGGTLDLASGVLTVTHVCREYDGSSDEEWTKGGNGYFVCKQEDCKKDERGLIPLCNKFLMEQTYAPSYCIRVLGSQNYASTDAEWRTWLTENPITVCYQLATPVTLQLSPTEITALVGNNTVWSDTNGENTVVFLKKG